MVAAMPEQQLKYMTDKIPELCGDGEISRPFMASKDAATTFCWDERMVLFHAEDRLRANSLDLNSPTIQWFIAQGAVLFCGDCKSLQLLCESLVRDPPTRIGSQINFTILPPH